MKYWALIILLSITLRTTAQELTYTPETSTSTDEEAASTTRAFNVLHAGLPLVVAGLAIQPASDEFKAMRDYNLYNAHTSVDDYLQYAPAALMLGLKAAGVESRSSWGRMLSSDAISIALVTLSVNALKLSVDVERPDSHANNSFPSGHTATAFMTATMLHKEYGAKSYWYSVGGYSVATATGLMRVVNDRHWISDVLVGAGIGIIATEVGYMLGDMLFGDKGINKDLDGYSDSPSWLTIERPSSAGLYLGAAMPVGRTTKSKSDSAHFELGSVIGLEGVYHLNQNFGLGGRLALTNASVMQDEVILDDMLNVVSTDVGGYYAKPLSDRWRVGAKALGGVRIYSPIASSNGETLISKGARGGFGTGANIEYLSNRHWAMKLFCDYDATYLSELNNTNLHQTISVGFVGNVIF